MFDGVNEDRVFREKNRVCGHVPHSTETWRFSSLYSKLRRLFFTILTITTAIPQNT